MSLPGGYVFCPSRYSPPIGHAGLEIELTDAPGARSGCIRAVTFPIVASQPSRRTFHDTRREDGAAETARVCAGCFRLRAGNDDFIGGFSFGGRVSLCETRDCTLCRLESSAPIFDVAFDLSSSVAFLCSEFGALLARRRALWRDDSVFGRRLAAVDPFALFVATLVELDAYLPRFTGSVWMAEYRRGAAAVRRAIATLRAAGEWPEPPPALGGLL